MRARVASFARLTFALAAPPLAAQRATPVPPIDECSYDRCALRVEPGGFFSRPTLVRGVDAERVARFGINGPDLAAIVAGSDSAVAHARAFRPHQLRAGVAGLLSTIAVVAAGVIARNAANVDNVAPLSIASIGLGVYAGYEARLAQREVARSVWWYNQRVAAPR
jgi:hypothetical protein